MRDPRSRGAVLLEAWRKALKLVQWRAAVLLDMDPSPYNKFERGKCTPGLATALKIERCTGGAVPVESWHEKSRARAAG